MANKPSAKRVRFGKTNQRVFEQHGMGFEDVDQDEFHEKYNTIDYNELPEAVPTNYTAVPESIRLLMELGPDNMDMERWSKVTGYKPVTAEEKAEYAAQEERNIVLQEKSVGPVELDAFIAAKTRRVPAEESLLRRETGTAPSSLRPQPVAWASCDPLALEASSSPFQFSRALQPRFSELEFDFALLMGEKRSTEHWHRELATRGFVEYNLTVQLTPTHPLIYYVSSAAKAFLVLLMLPDRETLVNYFVLAAME